MGFWQLGNTSVRSAMRIKDGLSALATSTIQGNIRKGEGDVAFRNLLGSCGVVTKYCRDHGITNYKIYKDDGYSGTNFKRPGFQEMLAGIEAGIIGTVIVKDMSRFGRNYLEVGLYTELHLTRAQTAYRI